MKKSNNPESINAQVNAVLVSNLLSDKVDANRLGELLRKHFSGEDLLRACLYLNGSLTLPSFQQYAERNGHQCTFKSYDVFEDRVYYTYVEKVTRYFDSEEQANNWLNESEPYAYAGESRESGNYVFPATRDITRQESTSSNFWQSAKGWDYALEA